MATKNKPKKQIINIHINNLDILVQSLARSMFLIKIQTEVTVCKNILSMIHIIKVTTCGMLITFNGLSKSHTDRIIGLLYRL